MRGCDMADARGRETAMTAPTKPMPDALERLLEAVAAGLTAWDAAKGKIDGLCMVAAVHGFQYDGPNVEEKMDALRQAAGEVRGMGECEHEESDELTRCTWCKISRQAARRAALQFLLRAVRGMR